jgi:membrane fusion protein, heavy metal efflux system
MKQIITSLIIVSLLVACGGKSSTKVETTEGSHTEEGHNEGGENIVSLTEEQIKTASIETGTIELKNLKTSIRASGTLSVPNQNKALITSVNSGVLKTLLIQPGSFVRKGQAVATIVNPDVARLQQELQTTNAQINLAEIELKRQRELVEGNAAPLKNVQRVQTELATLRATRNALTKQLSAMGISAASVSKGNIITTITITAPISGTVSTVSAQIGSPVDQSTPIAEIVNNSQLHLDLFVYEKDLPKLHQNQVIHFTLTNNPGKEYDAKIFSIGTAFVSETKTIPIHAVVMGDKTGLIEGMNITALISIGQSVVPAVPTEAIVNLQGQDYIFVQTEAPKEEGHKESEHKDGDEHAGENEHEEKPSRYFERVQVVKGASDVGYTEVTLLKDVRPKTPVVTKGAFFVLAKMSNTGGHEH